MQRLFSHAQKRHLYLSAEGRCQRCGEVLGVDWEAHHKIRFTDDGVTEVTNGEALCKRCHRNEGVDHEREASRLAKNSLKKIRRTR